MTQAKDETRAQAR